MNNCIICDQLIRGTSSILLINGTEIHQHCYYFLINPISQESEELKLLHSKKWELISLIENNKGILKTISRLINKEKNEEFLKFELELNNIKKKIIPLETSRTELQELCKRKLEKVYEFWYERPPDWTNRQYLIKQKYGSICTLCGNNKYLQVHHIVPINKGGNHGLENLILLCQKCHEIEHGGADFTGEYKKGGKSVFLGRLEKIKEALENQHDIYFHYTKYEGEMSIRTITPKGLRMEGTSLCVFGYCHLRKSERIFAIRRMNKIEIKY